MVNVDAKAYDFIVKYNINVLPIDPLTIDGTDYGIMSYTEGRGIIDSLGLTAELSKRKGITVNLDGYNIIMYDPDLYADERRYIVAHEIGHIMLEHPCYNNIVGGGRRRKDLRRQEQEADKFAYALLAPVPVFLALDVVDYNEIAQMTGLSIARAKTIAGYIDKRYGRNDHLTGIEHKVLITFDKYIDDYSRPQYRKGIYRRLLQAATVLLSVCAIVISVLAIMDISRIHNNQILPPSSAVTSAAESQNPSSPAAPSEPVSSDISSDTYNRSPAAADNKSAARAPRTVIVVNPQPALQDNKPSSVADQSAPAPASSAAPAAAPVAAVYVTTRGERYHRPDCRYVAYKTNVIGIESIDKARQLGYTPCEVCNP